jgi:hypothetical protein
MVWTAYQAGWSEQLTQQYGLDSLPSRMVRTAYPTGWSYQLTQQAGLDSLLSRMVGTAYPAGWSGQLTQQDGLNSLPSRMVWTCLMRICLARLAGQSSTMCFTASLSESEYFTVVQRNEGKMSLSTLELGFYFSFRLWGWGQFCRF